VNSHSNVSILRNITFYQLIFSRPTSMPSKWVLFKPTTIFIFLVIIMIIIANLIFVLISLKISEL